MLCRPSPLCLCLHTLFVFSVIVLLLSLKVTASSSSRDSPSASSTDSCHCEDAAVLNHSSHEMDVSSSSTSEAKSKYIVVYVPCRDQAEAEKIASTLLEAKLIACANILPAGTSMYRWEGKVAKDSETYMIMKSREDLFERISEVVRATHSYTTPAVLAWPLVSTPSPFFQWLDGELVPPAAASGELLNTA